MKKNREMNFLFMILLLAVFIMCTLFTVLIGARVYDRIYARMDNHYSMNTALSYISNKVRQGDAIPGVTVLSEDGKSVLKIGQEIDGEVYFTKIYSADGILMELFTDDQSGLTLQDGMPIMECPEVDFSMNEDLLEISMPEYPWNRVILMMKAGEADE